MKKGIPSDMMNEKKKLVIFWPQYRKHNSHFFQLLANEANVDVRIIWARNYRHDDPPDQGFIDKIPSNIIGAKSIRLSGYRIKSLFRLFSIGLKNIIWSDCILTSTQSPLHSKVAYIYSKLFNKKIFIIIQQWKKLKDKSMLYRLYENVGYHMIRNCDALLVHGENQKYFATKNGVKTSKIRVLPFLSDDLGKANITKQDITSQLGIDNKIVILYFGRIIERKGLKDLLEAYKIIEAQIPEAVLLVCGGADPHFNGYDKDLVYEKECIRIAGEFGERVIMTGAIKPDDKHNYLAIADVFVHPHATYKDLYEGWGLVINEAASMSLPIITTDRVGSAKDLVVEDVNGYILPAGNIEKLAESIKLLVKDEALRNKFSINSRKVFEKYHKPNEIVKVISQAINGK